MSFSKSRIRRFNETTNDVPPPGTYDPKFDGKVKGSIIEKSERFHNKNLVGGDVPPPGTYDPKFGGKVKGSVIEKSERFHNKTIIGGECDLTSLSKSTSSLHVNYKVVKSGKNYLSQKKTQTLEKQIEELEQEKSELNSCITRLTNEISEYKERLKGVITESDVKVYAMIRETKTAVEEEMRLAAERYEIYLRRVEMDRVALDEKLVQKDTEITRLCNILEEFKSSAETQESFGESLQMELDRAETELTRKKEELKTLKEQICSEAAEMVSRKKRFEIVMAENQASVAALTQHLTQNDTEAERLQHELKHGEDCINEHRNLLHIMRNNSQMVNEQVQALMEQLNAKKGLFNQLESDSLSNLESIKSVFDAKIENLRQVVINKVKQVQAQAQLQSDLDEKDAQIAKLQNQLEEVTKHLHAARVMLLELEEKNDAQELEISRLQLLNNKFNDELKASKATVEETNKLLEFQSTQHKVTLHEANVKIQELSDIIKDFEERDHLIQDKLLDEERACRIAVEEEIKKLLEYNERLAKDYKEISENYAELIGHQNHRQRIKHVSQLKDKINQLEQDLRIKIRTIGKQQKVIEELKAEKRYAGSKEKENMLGISKYAHSTPETSPHKLLTPLKDRNDSYLL